jgi:tetratricopeptide (TPR) repeat protein
MNFQTASKMIMSSVIGNFVRDIDRQRDDGFGWRFDGIDDWSTDAIFAKLHELGIDTDAGRFRDQARAAGQFKTLDDDWDRQATDDDRKDIGLWRDFPLFAVPTLWERLASDVLCWQLFERHLYEALNADEAGAPLPDVDGLPATVAAVTRLLDYLQALPEEERLKEWKGVNDGYYDYGEWFAELIDDEAEDRPEFALRVAEFLSGIADDEFVAARLAEILAQLGRRDEALTRIRASIEKHPGSSLVRQSAAEIHERLGDDAQAVRLWIESLPLAGDAECYEEVFAAMSPALERLGRSAELEEIRRSHPSPPPQPEEPPPRQFIDRPYESPAPRETPQPIHVGPKIGRNDPCPCGSGKKYKKCCLK